MPFLLSQFFSQKKLSGFASHKDSGGANNLFILIIHYTLFGFLV